MPTSTGKTSLLLVENKMADNSGDCYTVADPINTKHLGTLSSVVDMKCTVRTEWAPTASQRNRGGMFRQASKHTRTHTPLLDAVSH